ncbi:MAG: hypothetical protein M3O36_20720 [Myxococcota bacterium]|nr:hypothetical protein [Myxococcota bacterium]
MEDTPLNGAGLGVREDGDIVAPPHIDSSQDNHHVDTVGADTADANLRAQLDAVKAQLAAKEIELTEEKERARRSVHKRVFAKKVHELVDADPETDLAGEFAGCVSLTDFLKKGLGLLHLDTGPSEKKGMPMTGALLIERYVRRAAAEHGSFTDSFFVAASEPAEFKIAGRFNEIRHWLARGLNAYEFSLAVRAHGLDGARVRKASLPRLDVRGFDHLIAEADADAALTIVNDNNQQEK